MYKYITINMNIINKILSCISLGKDYPFKIAAGKGRE